MRRYPDATPCPAPHVSHASSRYGDFGRQSSLYAPSYAPDDTTANIEYTTELHAQLRQAKPRRPMRVSRHAKSAFDPAMDIFEDVAHEEEQQQEKAVQIKRRSRASVMPEGLAEKKTTILAHKAQKISTLSHAPPVQHSHVTKASRRRVSQILMDRQGSDANATIQLREDVLDKEELRRQGPRKDPRRRTIYVPSDDTTIVTIHPGQATHRTRNPREKSPDMGLDLVTLSEEEPEDLVSVLKKDKRLPRQSLAAPPKRGPLTQSKRPVQATSFTEDVFGAGGGKENVPPGTEIIINFEKEKVKKPAPKPSKVHFSTSRPVEPASTTSRTERSQKRPRSQIGHEGFPVKSIKARTEGTATTSRSSATRATTRSNIRTTIKNQISKAAPLSSSPFHTDRSPPTALRRQRQDRATTQISMLHVVGKPQAPCEKYPVLSEDLARPELYEDHWLTYQEVAITQLLNSLFDGSQPSSRSEEGPEDLRKKMLSLYHDPAIPLLHKRLQASLVYGALSIPKDLLAQSTRIKDDVGLRKRFLNLWVKTYDLPTLRAAAETIIGRQITVPCRLSSGSTSSDDGSRQFRTERRAIESFLDAFLIKNEDAVRMKAGVGSIANIARGDHNGDDFGSQGWAWRRTVLRSLMLILLLDQAKTADIVSGCLFQASSPWKTSVDVLHSLANMLLPSLGDITRPLGHLEYKVNHVQYPLQEYTYSIENIAIDLRDGIILTRLVELLLYTPSSLLERRDETVTITMPTGENLTSNSDDQKNNWPLSQHLRYPAIGRAQKLYNVQIALSSLTTVRDIPTQAISGITAEHIVDGHREKTLTLLWSLVGKQGLNTIVDWTQLVKETDRFRDSWYNHRDNYAQHDLDSDEEDEATTELQGLEYHKRLLLSWSRSIARLHGLKVTNLTTSFSNPKVLESIVDTYLPSSFTPKLANTKLNLAAKLKATGCSNSFIALFTPSPSSELNTIPSKDFTILTLSFLASRLLPLSLSHRAASTIQRAYRARLSRRKIHQRILAMKIAAEAAVIAQKREKLVIAAMVIQARWRKVLEDRKARLEDAVMGVQALARAWVVRRWARRVTAGRVGGKEKIRRVRGGW